MKSFRYSVVIYSSVVPGYVLGGYLAEWLDRKFAILLSFLSVAAFGTLFCARTVTNPDNDVCRIDSLLSVDRLHGDIHLHPRSPPNRDSDDGHGNRVCLGKSGRHDYAAGVRTLLCNPREFVVFSGHRPSSHWRGNCGPLLWPVNSWKAPSGDTTL